MEMKDIMDIKEHEKNLLELQELVKKNGWHGGVCEKKYGNNGVVYIYSFAVSRSEVPKIPESVELQSVD